MSTKDFILKIQSLPLWERISVIEEILKSISAEVKTSKRINNNEVRLRRKSFKVEAFDLGGEVTVDRDEIYSQRGV